MMIRISGNIWLTRIHPSAIRLRMPGRRAITYAAGKPITIVSTAVAVATLRLFHAACTRPFSVKAIR